MFEGLDESTCALYNFGLFFIYNLIIVPMSNWILPYELYK
jgi:hypothetical protein